jgi:hypothetical protein
VALDLAGKRIHAHTQIYEQIFRSFYDNTMALYRGQYGLFGDPEVLPMKIIWDYTYYWSVLAQLFFQGRLTDVASLAHLKDELGPRPAPEPGRAGPAAALEHGQPAPQPGADAGPGLGAVVRRAQPQPGRPLDDEAFRQRLRQATARLHALGSQMLERAQLDHPGLDGRDLQALLDGQGRHEVPHEPMLFARASPVAA